jgi:DNA-binding NarL/FixJ family response regulator
VFIVDDESDGRAPLASMLAGEGYDIVGKADSEFAAAAWLTRHPGAWDLAVIDFALQHGSGMNTVVRFVSAGGPGTVVIYTTYVSDSVRETGRLLGASATISKRDPEELQRFVRALVQARSSA